MIIASGYVEANSQSDIEKIVTEIKSRDAEVSGVNEEKITFLVEREDLGKVNRSVESFNDIEGVRSVYLTYYSLEGADEERSDDR
jgi:nitrate reductase NapAB chaperone NapD